MISTCEGVSSRQLQQILVLGDPQVDFPQHIYGQVAQLVEQRTENPRVGGSIPSLAIPPENLRRDPELQADHFSEGVRHEQEAQRLTGLASR